MTLLVCLFHAMLRLLVVQILSPACHDVHCHCSYVPLVMRAIWVMDRAYPRASVALPRFRTLRIGSRIVAVLVALLAVGGGVIWRKVTNNDLCALNESRPLSGTPEAAVCTGSPLSSDIDPYGRFMYSIVKTHIAAGDATAAHDESPLAIKEPKYDVPLPRVEVIPGTGWTIPTEDEDAEGETGVLADAVTKLIFDVAARSTALFPFHDSPVVWRDLGQARLALKVAAGEHLPAPAVDWTGVDFKSDETVARMVFAGLAGDRVRVLSPEERASDSDGAVFVADFGEMAALEVRSGFERFGATVRVAIARASAICRSCCSGKWAAQQ